jgi:hypothetical protein
MASLAAKVKGVAGLVVDGGVRDIDEMVEHRFPVFARHPVATTGRTRLKVNAINIPIEIDGVSVNPGDVIVADSTGVVARCAREIARIDEHLPRGLDLAGIPYRHFGQRRVDQLDQSADLSLVQLIAEGRHLRLRAAATNHVRRLLALEAAQVLRDQGRANAAQPRVAMTRSAMLAIKRGTVLRLCGPSPRHHEDAKKPQRGAPCDRA